MYNEEYKNKTLELLIYYLDDLSKWSVYNDDKHLDDIHNAINIIEKIKKEVSN